MHPSDHDFCTFCGADLGQQAWVSLRDIVATSLERRADTQGIPEAQGIEEPRTAMSVDAFMELLRKARLERACNFATALRPRHEDDVTDLANALISAGVLTKWQRNMLFQGRFRGLIFDRYELLAPLPSGKHRKTFLGQDLELHRKALFEVLPPQVHLDPAAISALLNMVRNYSLLDHPGIAAILAANLDSEVRYLAWEYVGESRLRELVESLGALPCEVATTICARAAMASVYAHDNGYVFGCISPGEIRLSTNGAVKLATIGIPPEVGATLLRQMLVSDRHAERYLDPTVADRDVPASEQSDVFSLGCILCFALTGSEPTSNDSWSLAADQIIGEQSGDDKSALRLICARMFARNVRDRQPSVRVAAHELVEWLRRTRRKQ